MKRSRENEDDQPTKETLEKIGEFLTKDRNIAFSVALQMPLRNLIALCGANRKFSQICKSEVLWERKLKNDYGITRKAPGIDTWKTSYYMVNVHNLQPGNVGFLTSPGLIRFTSKFEQFPLEPETRDKMNFTVSDFVLFNDLLTIFFPTSDPAFVFYSSLDPFTFKRNPATNLYYTDFKLQNGIRGKLFYFSKFRNDDPHHTTLHIDIMVLDKIDAWTKLLREHPDMARNLNEQLSESDDPPKFGDENYLEDDYSEMFAPMFPLFFKMFHMSRPFTE